VQRAVGFKRVWEKQGGCDPLFVWQAVPIDADHVALGHIVTSTPQQPDVNSMVTVHKSWLQPASKPPRLIWTDDGAGGGRAGALWEVEPGVLFATVGDPRVTGPPDQDTFYSFAFSGKTSVGSLEPADDEAIFLDAQQDEQPSYWQHPATGMYVHPVGGSAKRNVPLKLHPDGPRRNLRFCMDKNGELYHVDTELFVCVEKGGQGHPGAALMLGDAGSGPWVRGKGGVLTQARTGLVIICRGDAEDSRLLLGRAGGLEFCFTPADW